MIIKKNDPNSIKAVAESINGGGVVILPTDTVYGFSALADHYGRRESGGDHRIRVIKGRSETKPMIELIPDPLSIFKYTDDKIPESLLNKWPGSLTIIVHLKDVSSSTASSPTVAFRCPGDEWLRSVISLCDYPIYSTSVNRSGSPVLDEVSLIKAEFEDEVSMIVDDGDKQGALPFTIVSIDSGEVKILRQGAVRI